MTPTQAQQNYRSGIFTSRADYFEQAAASHQRIADSAGYRANPEARAAELREVAHYTELAAQAITRESGND